MKTLVKNILCYCVKYLFHLHLISLDCQNAFRAFFCWSNFPRCNAEGMSLILCGSVCENFFKACRYAKDLWRCGPTEYDNGYGTPYCFRICITIRTFDIHIRML